MKNRRLVAALAALALFCCTLAWGDYNTLNHGTYFANGASNQKTNSTGDLTTQEQFPAMDQNLTFPSAVQNASIAAGAADSSAVLDTHRMRLGTLLIKCTPLSVTGADSTSIVRLGVQIRSHLNGGSDSSSTFAFYMGGRTDLGANVAAGSQIDTSMVGQIFNAVNANPSANNVYSGEFVVAIMVSRTAIAATSAFGGTGARTFYYPNGLAIPLSSLFGRDLYSPYTSIRVRNLGTWMVNGAAISNKSVALTVHLVGTPL